MTKSVNQRNQFYELKIKGLVQGVGFRPFVYKLAKKSNLKGWVENRNDGVLIKINTNYKIANKFINTIKQNAPPASNIESILIQESEPEFFDSFQIKKSENISNKVTEVSPDIAVCENCLEDLKEQKHRINYPFINCTNCGPRFTIIKSLPYDRPETTMDEFKMCNKCTNEYTDILDRRFHAQPIACNDCGPQYTLKYKHTEITDLSEILKQTSQGVDEGKIYAIKGLGGFHIICNALNNEAVSRVRKLKMRDGKPFAVMFDSLSSLKEYTFLNEVEEELVTSWKRPIVLLKRKKELAYDVCNGLSQVGVMLPYMPFHYLLFEHLKSKTVVLTSGNISNEPIILSNKEAIEKFENIVDGVITYNREIYNRTDDSVLTVNNLKPRIIRRSRGFTPSPIRTSLHTEGIFAAGAELVNSFCIGKGNQAILSQYIGDLKNFETYDFYKETYERFSKLFNFAPEIIVRDLHPDYLSSQFAESIVNQNENIKLIKVQHHHAHIASVMIDHGIDKKVIAISLDGIGLGDDNKIWGAEFFECDLVSYKRKFHFEYMPMPGGDKATKEPWRMAVSYLYNSFGEEIYSLDLPLFKKIDLNKIKTLIQLIKKEINAPLASSAGRLFDGVAGILGVNLKASFHAEAPMRLEAIIDHTAKGLYTYAINESTISFNKTIQGIANDKITGIDNGIISTKFHNTIIDVILNGVDILFSQNKIKDIVMSGGTFQNKYIIENLENKLIEKGYLVYLPANIPFNDQGIAMGQLAIAAKMREKGML